MTSSRPGRALDLGPVLHLRGLDQDRVDLAALVIRPEDAPAGTLETADGRHAPECLLRHRGAVALRYRFTLPARADAWYRLEGRRFCVDAAFGGDLRIGFVSCNGQEHGDLDRPEAERNAMWARLAEDHRTAPLNLLLHGGDQIYADEVTRAHPLSRDWPDRLQGALSEADAADLGAAFDEAFFRRYATHMSAPAFAGLAAEVPSLAIWDDHDICDGWGSLPRTVLDSPIGRILFAAARRAFLLFQLCAGAEEVPPICPDRSGTSLGWAVDLPGLRIVAPDLRSERRPDRVMGPAGWTMLRGALADPPQGRTLVVSSVPALGPRLSLIERLMNVIPKLQKYEDDLRDQWQSRTHRAEWCDFLKLLLAAHEQPGAALTAISGEIHLATRAEMASAAGPLRQLVASGIAHPAPPNAYARGLGALARFGEGPLDGHQITIRPLPGQRAIYTAERNYLVLTRQRGAWSAEWELEQSGRTPPLAL